VFNRSVISALLLTVIVGLSLVPMGLLIKDRIQYADLVDRSASPGLSRGFDWVYWDDRDGQITAVYVFPKGNADEAGIQTGDVLYEFDFMQYFTSDDLKNVIEGIPSGEKRTYTLLRGNDLVLVEVTFGRYPIFLYPLGSALWSASIWGFILGAFIHLLALIIVIPLSVRSRSAFLSLLLIAASAVWVFGNLGRILLVTWFGPMEAFGPLNSLFDTLTFGSLLGWIGFPVLLVIKVLWDIKPLHSIARRMALVLTIPPILLVASGVVAVVAPGSVAPVTLESLIAPILFYVCCYVAAAAALSLAYASTPDESGDADLDSPGWSRLGSTIVMAVASLAALSVFGVVPVFGVITDEGAGWIVVATQLLSVAPVLLISFATLKYGKVDQVLRRSLTYVTVLGLFFFLFVGGLSWILEDVERLGAPVVLMAGLYAVLLLFVFDRGWRLIGPYAMEFFATDRQRARHRVGQFTEKMRSFVSFEELLGKSAQTIHEVLGPRQTYLHLKTDEGDVTAAYPDRDRSLTPETVEHIWPTFEETPVLWARNPELNLATVPADVARTLYASGAALVNPLVDDGHLKGLLVLGRKSSRRAVYTLEDVDLVRSLSTHMALSVERLEHIEREKELIRTTAESQLTALRAQINPHFLFNTLNAIASLIEEKPDEAERTVEHLSAIFRQTLEVGGEPFAPLGREMLLVERYLAIEQIRFGDRLRFEKEIPSQLAGTLVPAFAIQTLIENSVKHGISKKREGGLIRVSARLVSPDPGSGGGGNGAQPTFVDIEVFDSGVGIPQLFGAGSVSVSDVDFRGIGLTNVTTRLEKLYDRTDLLTLKSESGKGTSVVMQVPVTEEITKHSPGS
jgi:hypothetical protein